MAKEKLMRITKDLYYLSIANTVSARSTCLRRNFGVVLVKDDQIISTGYNGPPRGEKHCVVCAREELNIEPGTHYEECRAVHAEMNAVINAARAGAPTIGSTLYIYGYSHKLVPYFYGLWHMEEGEIIAVNPCKMCARVIKNAGIIRVVGRDIRHKHMNRLQCGSVLEWDFETTY